MKDFFGMTQEQFKAWLNKHSDIEEPGGIMACSPEIYAEMMAANEKAFKDHVDSAKQPVGPKPDNTSGGGTEGK